MSSPFSIDTPAQLLGPRTSKEFQDIFEDLWKTLVLSDWENVVFHAITKWLLLEKLEFLADGSKHYLEVSIEELPDFLKHAILGMDCSEKNASEGYPTQTYRLFNQIINSTKIVLNDEELTTKTRSVSFYNGKLIHQEELLYCMSETRTIEALVTNILPPQPLLEEARFVCKYCGHGSGTEIDNPDFPFIFSEDPVISRPKIGNYRRYIKDWSHRKCKNKECKEQGQVLRGYEIIHMRSAFSFYQMITAQGSVTGMNEKISLRLEDPFIEKLSLMKSYLFTVEIDGKSLRASNQNQRLNNIFPLVLRVIGVREKDNSSILDPLEKSKRQELEETPEAKELDQKVNQLNQEVQRYFNTMLEQDSNPNQQTIVSNCYSFLARNIAPSVWEMIPNKIAILLQLVLKKRPNSKNGRGNLHILLWWVTFCHEEF